MTDEIPAAPAPAKASLVEDFVDIFVSPREVFARRANSGFFVVMVIVTLLVGGLFLANRGTMADIIDAEMARGMATAMKQNPSITPEQMEAGKKVGGYMATFGAFIGVPIAMFFIGFFAWLTAKMLGATLSYTAATMIASYSYIPRVLEALSISVQGLLLDTTGLRGRFQLSLGVGRFLDPEMSPGLLGLLGRIDIFTIWVTVLLVLGLMVVAKLPKAKAVPAGAILWLFGALPAFWQMLR